ncbi:hypothetical protein CR194_06135 [Salipaludibacillus keqinensis]|uniref:Uncharacterized protein n=1 Tax=Salipaludibacillus keqinensis TaxID=2045207 RepID=A0A323TKH7_9BACI|nr:hypothetical protein [Salipaludibacillus keqinensis]PYZ95090.1 hypothetical protein CR194_06135 [Salipaludibacillus keqinensis]
MSNYEKEAYFELRDKLIKRLPEPEKSVYRYFRGIEKTNLERTGRLVVDGKTPVESTAEHFQMTIEETKDVCRSASLKLQELARKQ